MIEKCEKDSTHWTKTAETKGPDCKGTADNLEEGVAYEFRVRRPALPNQASKPVTAKPRKCK